MRKTDIINNDKYVALNKTYDEKYPITVLDFPRDLGRTIHPTQKPVKLFEYLIKTYSKVGDTVLDNCIGSGTTAIACINTGRKWIGIDSDSEMIEKARKRINKHLELHPELEKIATIDHDSYWKEQQQIRLYEALKAKYPDPSIAPKRVQKLLGYVTN